MGGICLSCKFFRANVHKGADKPHHCDFQNVPLSDSEANAPCDECQPKNCSH